MVYRYRQWLGAVVACVLWTGLPSAAFPVAQAQTMSAQQPYGQAVLDQLLAPIALYPDPLLTQVLVAATYPLEVIQAEQFIKANPNRQGNSLAHMVKDKPWDTSVKALAEFPSVLTMMHDNLEWTQQLGDAFLAQQVEVMDTVQSLRQKAQAQVRVHGGVRCGLCRRATRHPDGPGAAVGSSPRPADQPRNIL